MSIFIYTEPSIEAALTLLDRSDTLILSTQNRRYKSMQHAKVFQIVSEEIFTTALDDFAAGVYLLDLFDDLTQRIPKVLGAFLDDFEAGVFEGCELYIAVRDNSLIEAWELYDVNYL